MIFMKYYPPAEIEKSLIDRLFDPVKDFLSEHKGLAVAGLTTLALVGGITIGSILSRPVKQIQSTQPPVVIERILVQTPTPPEMISTLPPSPTPTYTLTTTYTPTLTYTPTSSPTLTPPPTNTQTPTLTYTPTPHPTNTPLPKPTNTPTPHVIREYPEKDAQGNVWWVNQWSDGRYTKDIVATPTYTPISRPTHTPLPPSPTNIPTATPIPFQPPNPPSNVSVEGGTAYNCSGNIPCRCLRVTWKDNSNNEDAFHIRVAVPDFSQEGNASRNEQSWETGVPFHCGKTYSLNITVWAFKWTKYHKETEEWDSLFSDPATLYLPSYIVPDC